MGHSEAQPCDLVNLLKHKMIGRMAYCSKNIIYADDQCTEWSKVNFMPGNNLGEPEAFSANGTCPEGSIRSALFFAVYTQPARELEHNFRCEATRVFQNDMELVHSLNAL